MRTRWGKLAKQKAGQEATHGELTEREQWIHDSLSFLREHVVPTKSRQTNVGMDLPFFNIVSHSRLTLQQISAMTEISG